MTEPLWAPWRMEFIEGPKPSSCFFCEAAALDPSRDAERLVLARGTRAFALMNLYPYSNGHLMLAPTAHLASLELLDVPTAQEVMALTQRSLRVLGAVLHPDGFNIGINLGAAAGAGVADHVHQHVVPRWRGDTNFMPVLAEVKVMSEHIRTTYAKLRAGFDSIP